MPRYFFHVRDRDRLTSDEDGLELPDPASAHAEAEAGARDMLEDALLAGEDISNQVIDTLIEYSQKLDGDKDDKLLLEIADAVFMYDSINQEALVIKCSVLNKKGKYSLARTWYDHFVKEYKNLYAENYPRTFEDVIS